MRFTLEARGPCRVTSEDLRWSPVGSQRASVGELADVRIADPSVTLAHLGEEQSLSLECHVVRGTGSKNIRWCPAPEVSYRMLPVLEVHEVRNPQAVLSLCPTKVFDIEGDSLRASRPRDCSMCGLCRDKGVRVSRHDSVILFHLRGNGSMPPTKIFVEAVRTLRSGVSKVQDALQSATGVNTPSTSSGVGKRSTPVSGLHSRNGAPPTDSHSCACDKREFTVGSDPRCACATPA